MVWLGTKNKKTTKKLLRKTIKRDSHLFLIDFSLFCFSKTSNNTQNLSISTNATKEEGKNTVRGWLGWASQSDAREIKKRGSKNAPGRKTRWKESKSCGTSWRVCNPWWSWCYGDACKMLCSWMRDWRGCGTCKGTDFGSRDEKKQGGTVVVKNHQCFEANKVHRTKVFVSDIWLNILWMLYLFVSFGCRVSSKILHSETISFCAQHSGLPINQLCSSVTPWPDIFYSRTETTLWITLLCKWLTGGRIGDMGATLLSESLKTNTTLKTLCLKCEQKQRTSYTYPHSTISH